MKVNLINGTRVFSFALAFGFAATSASAASFMIGVQDIIASQNNTVWGNSSNENIPYNVSVNANNPGYAALYPNDSSGNDATPFERDISEPIQGWLFAGGNSNDVLEIWSQKGGLITQSTTDTSFDRFAQDQAYLWTTNDPGSNLLSPSTSQNTISSAYRSIDNVTGSIDISGMTSGTVYFFYGAYRHTPSIGATMKDTDGPELDLPIANLHGGDQANNEEMYVASVAFVNDMGYDTIDYDFSGGSAGRWGGIVVAGIAIPVPEPSSAVILGFGGLALILRRRK